MPSIDTESPARVAARPSPMGLDWVPFAGLNLRYNPFGELTRAQRVAAAIVDVEGVIEWLLGPPGAAPTRAYSPRAHSTGADSTRANSTGAEGAEAALRAVQFVGDCGRGKTTHLLSLLACLPAAAYVYLPADAPTPPIPSGCPLLVDEAQRLPWWIRRRVFRRHVPLVLGTHVDLTGPLSRQGYVVRTIEVGEHLDAAKLADMLNRRIESARLRPGELPRVSREDAARLIGKFGNDIRSIESYLYKQLQVWKRAEHGKLRFVD